MFDILRLLIQFVFRVTFGLALAMGLTPPRLVTSGYYQKHLWVLMGMNTLASLAVYSQRAKLSGTLVGAGGLLAVAIGLAIGAYVGSVCWLAERPWGGRLALFLVAAGGLAAAILATPGNDGPAGRSPS